ncbi:ABC transporter permease [Naasia aerilata]|uniref:Peptide ABC transporter permease n=1 Tax=Naasia aerilata TaxID=1162966 RepID=A0ABN6XPT1_9MICO|nr:ABC transporter permease [Naasia aerilata]BDZ46158.1 peptide ABC transporter permease [Naasia aerilata]
MILYLLRRVLNYVILTVIASCGAYMLASATMNPTYPLEQRHPRPPQSTIDSLRDAWGVNPDVPLIERTWTWFTGVLHGDFGLGVNNHPVADALFSRAGVSLQLLLIGSILGAVLGVVLGVWGAVRQYRASDQVVTYGSYFIIAMPTYVLAYVLMLIAIFVNSVLGFHLLAFVGQYSADQPAGFFPQLWDRATHLFLPTLVLVLGAAASYSRYQRSAMLDVLGSDYIRTARAKGLLRGRALVRHGVRVALIPMSTYFAYSFGLLVTGATILEIVFSWHGMGELSVISIQKEDVNSIAGSTFFVAVLILCSSTLSEVLNAALDPRVRR